MEPAPELPGSVATMPHEFIVHSKWDLAFYGFVEADSIYDTTQGLNDLAGNSAIAIPGTYAGNHGQTTFGARNSRIGMKLAAPEFGSIKSSGLLEMDFLGNEATGVAAPTEAQFWNNPGLRIRHAYVKMETPIVDVLFGQTWELFGWQSMFHPNTVEIQGVPGQIYSRTPQIRVSKKIESGDVAVELAIAASRPPERDSATPDGQAGVKLTYNGIKALHTAGATGTAVDGLSIGVSGVLRRFAVNNFAAASAYEVVTDGYGLSIDALVPIIPAGKVHHENALTLTGSYVTGAGINDLYTGLTGGVSDPGLPNPAKANPAPAYTPDIDNGLAMWYRALPGGAYTLHPVQWTSYMVGLQYYLPPHGHVWVAVNYSNLQSDNAKYFGAPTKVWNQEQWADANLFVDVTPAIRLGVEFAWFQQQYVSNVDATNYRGQFSAFYLF